MRQSASGARAHRGGWPVLPQPPWPSRSRQRVSPDCPVWLWYRAVINAWSRPTPCCVGGLVAPVCPCSCHPGHGDAAEARSRRVIARVQGDAAAGPTASAAPREMAVAPGASPAGADDASSRPLDGAPSLPRSGSGVFRGAFAGDAFGAPKGVRERLEDSLRAAHHLNSRRVELGVHGPPVAGSPPKPATRPADTAPPPVSARSGDTSQGGAAVPERWDVRQPLDVGSRGLGGGSDADRGDGDAQWPSHARAAQRHTARRPARDSDDGGVTSAAAPSSSSSPAVAATVSAASSSAKKRHKRGRTLRSKHSHAGSGHGPFTVDGDGGDGPHAARSHTHSRQHHPEGEDGPTAHQTAERALRKKRSGGGTHFRRVGHSPISSGNDSPGPASASSPGGEAAGRASASAFAFPVSSGADRHSGGRHSDIAPEADTERPHLRSHRDSHAHVHDLGDRRDAGGGGAAMSASSAGATAGVATAGAAAGAADGAPASAGAGAMRTTSPIGSPGGRNAVTTARTTRHAQAHAQAQVHDGSAAAGWVGASATTSRQPPVPGSQGGVADDSAWSAHSSASGGSGDSGVAPRVTSGRGGIGGSGMPRGSSWAARAGALSQAQSEAAWASAAAARAHTHAHAHGLMMGPSPSPLLSPAPPPTPVRVRQQADAARNQARVHRDFGVPPPHHSHSHSAGGGAAAGSMDGHTTAGAGGRVSSPPHLVGGATHRPVSSEGGSHVRTRARAPAPGMPPSGTGAGVGTPTDCLSGVTAVGAAGEGELTLEQKREKLRQMRAQLSANLRGYQEKLRVGTAAEREKSECLCWDQILLAGGLAGYHTWLTRTVRASNLLCHPRSLSGGCPVREPARHGARAHAFRQLRVGVR